MQPKYGHLVKMLDMLTSTYARQDIQNVKHGRALETNIGKLFSLLAEGLEVVHTNAEIVRDWDDLEKAEGKVLDRYGANFGVARGAASDALYRIFIRVKMLAQLSGGDWDTVIYAACELLGIEYTDLDSEDVYPAKIALYVDEDLLSDERLELIDQIAAAIKRVLAAGVGMHLYTRTYRTYRMVLPMSYGALIIATEWAAPMPEDRTGRIDLPAHFGAFAGSAYDVLPVGKARTARHTVYAGQAGVLEPYLQGNPSGQERRASYANTGAYGAIYHAHLKSKRIE